MASFSLKSGLELAVLLLLGCIASAQEDEDPLPISLDAESSSFDRKNGTVSFRGLRITQGDFIIRADEAIASDLDFERSEWRFSGNIRVSIDSASIESSEAEATFESHELLVAELRGNPAVFQDANPERETAIRGGADRLQYDNRTRTLRMTEGAWLNEGPNEFRGCDLIYDFEQEKITSGSSDCGEPVVITILPPADDAGTNRPAEP